MVFRMIRTVALILALSCGAQVSAAERWYRADTHHFTIYSNGRSGQLEDFAHEAEKFDGLLRMLFKRPVQAEPTKLTIYLLDDVGEVQKLAGGNVAGFYSPRTEGSFAVGNRVFGADKDDLTGKRVLLHEYAHHFMFNNFAIPAPSWFVEGFAEFVSTAEFKRNGDWTFGMPAHHRAYSVQNGPPIPIETLLTATPRGMSGEQGAAFYGWAWALTHMLYSDPEQRGDQIVRYLADINSGMDNLEAAEKNFGDLNQLERSLRGYVRKSMSYSKSDKAIPYRDSIAVTQVPDGAAELVQLALERRARPDAGLRDELAALAASGSAGADAWVELGEVEFALAHRKDADKQHDFTAANAAVDRALALDGDHVQANLLKGRLLLEPFDHDDEPDAANWEAARAYFLKANRGDPRDAAPLYYYANTFLRQGKRHDMVGPALETAFGFRPESSRLRSALANYYAREREYDKAIDLLAIIANNPHGGGWAKRVIANLEKRRDGDENASVDFTVDEDEDEESGED